MKKAQKKLEKKIQQKITNNNEANLKNYRIEFGLDSVNKIDTKKVSKTNYKMSNLFQSTKDLVIKYPIVFTQNKKHGNIEIIKTGKGHVKPNLFNVQNKSFCITSKAIMSTFYSIQKPVLLFCKILYQFKTKNNIC